MAGEDLERSWPHEGQEGKGASQALVPSVRS